MKLRTATSLKALRKVRHNRDRRTSHLITKAIILRELARAGYVVDLARQNSGLLPGDEILKFADSLLCLHANFLSPQPSFPHSVLSPHSSVLIPQSWLRAQSSVL